MWGVHEQEEALILTAAAPLRAGWRLPMRIQMEDAIFENLLLDWGPTAAAHAVKGATISSDPFMAGLHSCWPCL